MRRLEKGQLKFELHGERLKGGFALVRPRSREKEKRENWLLVKERDERADRSSDPIRKWTKSVATGRTFEEISRRRRRLELEERPKRRRPATAAPKAAPPGANPSHAALSTAAARRFIDHAAVRT